MFKVTSREFFNQLNNGADFSQNVSDNTPNLVGNAMNRIVAETKLTLTVVSDASATVQFTVAATTITKINDDTLSATDWIDDGWNIGDTFSVTGVIAFTGTITDLSGLVLTYTLNSGTNTPNTYSNLSVKTTTEYNDCLIRFNLPENSDNSNSFVNAVDGSIQGFTATQLTASLKTATPFAGAKSWITGDCQVSVTALTNGVRTYTVRQEFIILPYYLQDFDDNLIDGTLPDDFFSGTQSLKYTLNFEARKALTDPNISNVVTDLNQQGSVGWFNENFNGGANNYTATITDYQDTTSLAVVDSLQIEKRTTVNIRVTNTNNLFTVNTNLAAYVSAVLTPAQYAANNRTYKDLWLYDNAMQQVGASDVLTGIIKNLSSTFVDPNTIDIAVVIEYDTSQQTRLNAGQQYILAVGIADSTLSSANSDAVTLLADLADYISDTDIPDLMIMNDLTFRNYQHALIDTPNTNVNGWIEDGIFTELNFGLDYSKEAVLEELVFKVIARNTVGNEFIIQQFPFDLSSGLFVPVGSTFKQVFNYDTTRGFPLPVGDFFNRVRLGTPIDLIGYFYGTQDSLSPITTVPFNSELSNNYITVFTDNGIADFGSPTQALTGFTLPTGVSGVQFSWFSIAANTNIAGVRFGSVALTAGANKVVSFSSSIGGADYALIPLDLQKRGMVFTGTDASKTANGFTVTDVPVAGTLIYIAILDGALSNFRRLQNVSFVDGDTINYSSTLGTRDYTLLIYDMDNQNNYIVYEKLNAGLKIISSSAGFGRINVIAILN